MKSISPEIRKRVIEDIKKSYLTKSILTQKDLALKHKVSPTTVRKLVNEAMKEITNENKAKKEWEEKMINSEEEIVKYGIPEQYKLIKKSK